MGRACPVLAVFVLSVALMSSTALAADIDPKDVTSATIKITKSGKLTPSAGVGSAELTLYIAQEGQQSIEVTPNSWEYVYDNESNKMVKIKFGGFTAVQPYSVAQTVKTSVQPLAAEAAIGNDPDYVVDTDSSRITAEITAAAEPFDKSLEGVAGMAVWVNEHVTYDKTMFEQNKPSNWVLANRKGVCVEFSNLLAAMLRSKGIPTRHVSGYAYSEDEKSLQGHAWVEVLTSSGWTAFDPTWVEGGTLDATHVRTSSTLGGAEQDRLSYTSSSAIRWTAEPEKLEIISHETDSSTTVEASANPSDNEISATASFDGCKIMELTATSCEDKNGDKLLEIARSYRALWGCGSADAVWNFSHTIDVQSGIVCPVMVYDQAGHKAQVDITLSPPTQSAPAGAPPALSDPGKGLAGIFDNIMAVINSIINAIMGIFGGK